MVPGSLPKRPLMPRTALAWLISGLLLSGVSATAAAWEQTAQTSVDARYRQAEQQRQDAERRQQDQMRQRQDDERRYQDQQRRQAEERRRRVDERQRQAQTRGLGRQSDSTDADWRRKQQAGFKQAERDRIAFEIDDNRRRMEADRDHTDRMRAQVGGREAERMRLEFEQRRQGYERRREALEQQRSRIESLAD